MMRPTASRRPVMTVAIRRTLTLLAVLVSPALAISQPNKASDEPIPRELAMALLNLMPGTGGPTDILVGKAPDNIPPELIPPGYQVLGSLIQYENASIVLIAPQPPDSAISALEA